MAKQVQPTISLGLPVFNGEDHIRKSIVSILRQTYQNWELIITDNASTDRTQDICEKFLKLESRIKYYRNSDNIGAARNYNLCVDHTSGKYFKWCSDDDFINTTFLEVAIDLLEKEEDIILVQPNVLEFGFAEKHLKNAHLPALLSGRMETRLLSFLSWFDGNSRPESIFGVIRMDALKKSSLIESYIGSDYVLLWELCILGKFGRINDMVLYKRYEEKRNDLSRKNYVDFSKWFNPSNGVKVYVPLFRIIMKMNNMLTLHKLGFKLRVSIRFRLIRLVISNWKPLLAQLRLGLIYYLTSKTKS